MQEDRDFSVAEDFLKMDIPSFSALDRGLATPIVVADPPSKAEKEGISIFKKPSATEKARPSCMQ